MSESPTTENSVTPSPPQSREGAAESSSSPGKDPKAPRKSVYFEQTSESGPPAAAGSRRSSLAKENVGTESKVSEPSPANVEEKTEPQPPRVKESEPSETSTDAPAPAGVDAPSNISTGAQEKESQGPESLPDSTQASSPSEPSQPLTPQQESAESPSPNTPPKRASITDPEQIQTSLPAVDGEATSSSDPENMSGKGRRMSRRASTMGPGGKSRRKSSVYKEIVGSIEKKKGPIVPDKLGFGSSEDRKAVMVEVKRRGSTAVPKEPEDVQKPVEVKKVVPQGLGFGSSARRTTIFDKDDTYSKEKRKSVFSKEDEKDMAGGSKGRRVSQMKDPGSLIDPRAVSSATTATTGTTATTMTATPPEDGDAKAGEGAPQDMNQQASDQQQIEPTDGKQLSSDELQQLVVGEQQFLQDISQEGESPVYTMVVGAAEKPPPGDLGSPGGNEDSESDEGARPKFMRDRAPSIYERAPSIKYNNARAPSIDSIPLDDNEGLTSTLLGGKVDEPLRNELENWLSSAIHRVDNNLSSNWAEPVLRHDKDSPRRTSEPPRAPRNTLVAQPDSSSTSSKDLSRRPSMTSLRNMQRSSVLSMNILAGTLSDENKLLNTWELTDPTPSPKQEMQDYSAPETAILTPKVVVSSGGEQRDSHWTPETAEEGLRRLQREVEQRAWATNIAKKSPRLLLPDSLRKRKKPAESVAASDYLHSESGQGPPVQDKILNKDLLCRYGGTEDAAKLKNAGLSGLNIVGVAESDLAQFSNLQCLDLSINQLNMQDLCALSQLRKLSLMSNQIYHLRLPSGHFNQLQALDLSYNLLGGSAIVDLSNLPVLETLNVNHNSIAEIPEAAGGQTWSFPRLRIFSAAHNFIKSRSLLPLSKIPRLEKLLLPHNRIRGVPDEINEIGMDFPRLKILDLTNNTVADSHRLTPLLRCRSLKQLLLLETPIARKLVCDGANKLLDSARPILQHILRAQQAGQNWITEQSPPEKAQFEEKMHIIPQFKAPEIKLFDSKAEQEMAYVFKYTSEDIRKEAGDKHCGLHQGYTSQILPFIDDFGEPVMSISETREWDRVPSEVATSDIPPSMDEAMDNIQISTNLTQNHLTDASAAITCLQNTLGVPFREVEFNPKHYLTMTKSGIIRVNEYRLGNQELTSPRKDAVYLAQRFLYQAEVEERGKVHNVLERMRLHLAEMDDVLQETLIQPPPFSPPRKMSSVGDYTDSEGMLTFR